MTRSSSYSVRGLNVMAVASLASLAVLSACGASSPATSGEAAKSSTQIFHDAEHATETATSVHIMGRSTSGSGDISFDFVDSSARSGGTLTENGAALQVVLSGTKVYLMGSASSMATITGDQAAGQLLGGKWLQTTTANKDFGSLVKLFNLTTLVQAIQPKGTLRKGGTSTVPGSPAVALTDSARKATLYVATTGSPYMLEIVNPSEGTIRFEQYGSARPPAVPTGAINLDQLESGTPAA